MKRNKMSFYKIEAKLKKREKRVKKEKSTKKKVLKSKNKKVNFPWLKSKLGCFAKAYMCFIVDEKYDNLNFSRNLKKKKEFFSEKIYPIICNKYPELYNEILTYYAKKGKDFNHAHYHELLYARLTNCYENGFMIRTNEHPTKSLNPEYAEAYRSFF